MIRGVFFMEKDYEKEISRYEKEASRANSKLNIIVALYFVCLIGAWISVFLFLCEGEFYNFFDYLWLDVVIFIVLTVISFVISAPYERKKKEARLNKYKLENEKTISLETAFYNVYLDEYNKECAKYAGFKSFNDLKIGVLNGNFMVVSLTPPKKPDYECTAKNITFEKTEKYNIQTYIDIPLEDFIYFKKEGSVQYTTEVSGGGTSLGGAVLGGIIGEAVIGGAIASATGAIIGSRKPIKSQTVEHDNRVTIIKTRTNEYTGSAELYDVLMDIVPEKEFSYILVTGNANNKSALQNNHTATLPENTNGSK